MSRVLVRETHLLAIILAKTKTISRFRLNRQPDLAFYCNIEGSGLLDLFQNHEMISEICICSLMSQSDG